MEVPNSVPTPLVSVCIQTYQHEAFIEQCVRSVLKQRTDFPFEIIIGEDESPDRTRDICRRLAKEDERIRLFERSRRDVIKIFGKPTGRFNFVSNLEAARGQYVALLDGDDFWESPNKLQTQIDRFRQDPQLAICYCNHYTYDLDQKRAEPAHQDQQDHYFNFAQSIQYKQGAAPGCCFRRELVCPDLLLQLTINCAMADWPVEVICSLQGKGLRLPTPLVAHRLHQNGATQTLLASQKVFLGSRIDFLSKLLNQRQIPIPDDDRLRIFKILYRLYIMRSSYHFRNEDWQQYLRDWQQALRFFGKSMFKKPMIDWVGRYSFMNIAKFVLGNHARFFYQLMK